jgi:carbonic anhydrase
MSEPIEAAAPAAKGARGAWLKANVLAVALGVQMVVLVVALVALGVSGSKTVAVPAASASSGEEAAAEEAPAEAAAVEPAAEAPGEEGPAAAPAAAEAHEEPAKGHAAPAGTDAATASKAKKDRAAAARAATSEPAHEPDAHAAQPAAEEPPLARAVSALMDGNERFAEGVTRLRDPAALRRAPGTPVAVVVACADATVPPELLFDQSLGALVVVRTAAALVDEGSLAAVEDAVARLHVPLVLVLGHRGCHSVAVAASGAKAGPGLATVAARLKPVMGALRKGGLDGKALAARAVGASVDFAAGQLSRRSQVLRASQVPIMRAVYDEATGKVEWLDAAEEPAAAAAHPPVRSARAAH